tara:strand:- start:985 stop:1110 length:126 start_codon:yes stop_codon:yes gene_type:complete
MSYDEPTEQLTGPRIQAPPNVDSMVPRAPVYEEQPYNYMQE